MAISNLESAPRPPLLRSQSLPARLQSPLRGRSRPDLRPRLLQALHLAPGSEATSGRLIISGPALLPPPAATPAAAVRIARSLYATGVQVTSPASVAGATGQRAVAGAGTSHCQIWPHGGGAPVLLFDPPEQKELCLAGTQPIRRLAHLLYGPITLLALAESYERFPPQPPADGGPLAAHLEQLAPWTAATSDRVWADIAGGIQARSAYTPLAVIACYKQLHVIRPLAQASLGRLFSSLFLSERPESDRALLGDRLLDQVGLTLERLHEAQLSHGDVRPERILFSSQVRPWSAGNGPKAFSQFRFDLAKFATARSAPTLADMVGAQGWASPQTLACALRGAGEVPSGIGDDWFRLARSVLFVTNVQERRSFTGPAIPLHCPAHLSYAPATLRLGPSHFLLEQLDCWRFGLDLYLASSRPQCRSIGGEEQERREAIAAEETNGIFAKVNRLSDAHKRDIESWLEFAGKQLQASRDFRYVELLYLLLRPFEAAPDAASLRHMRGLLWPPLLQQTRNEGLLPPAELRAQWLKEDDVCLWLTSEGCLSPYYELARRHQTIGSERLERDLYPGQGPGGAPQ